MYWLKWYENWLYCSFPYGYDGVKKLNDFTENQLIHCLAQPNFAPPPMGKWGSWHRYIWGLIF